jgi:hypothetical protein
MDMNDYSQWARAALQFPNMAVCVIDTTGIRNDADILRVFVHTVTGEIYDQLFWSERHDTSNEQYTGIPEQAAKAAPALAEKWEHLKDVLISHYLIAYNLDFVQASLNENAEHYGLEMFHLIGDCLQHAAVEYFRETYNLKLAHACQRIGHILPLKPVAQDRAQAILALLRAMAAGYEIPMDDHPF